MSLSYVRWLRGQVGPAKVFLPFATVIARDERQRVLLQRRTDFNFWGLPGGVLELDEDIEQGARRELYEETGLAVGPLRLVGIYTDPKYDVTYPNGDQVQQFTFCLEGIVSGGQMRADGLEASEQRFVRREDWADYGLPVWYRDMLWEAELGIEPQFRAPNQPHVTADQIATIRPRVGNTIFSAMGVSVVLTDDAGRMLMAQHKSERHWRVPSGFANLGENAAQTAVREVYEELRLDIEPVRLIGVHATPQLNTVYANGHEVRVVGVVFQVRCTGGTLRIDPCEIDQISWMTPQEALANVHPFRARHYEDILQHLQEGCFVR